MSLSKKEGDKVVEKVDGVIGDQTWNALGLGFEGVGDSYAQKGTYEQYAKVLESKPVANIVGSPKKLKPNDYEDANGYYPKQVKFLDFCQ